MSALQTNHAGTPDGLSVVAPQNGAVLECPGPFDVFVDLTRCRLENRQVRAWLDQLVRALSPAILQGQISVATGEPLEPEQSTFGVQIASHQSASAQLATAMRRASFRNRHLIVLLHTLVPSQEAVQLLIAAFEEDPLLGTAQPRFAQTATDRVWPLPGVPRGSWPGPTTSQSAARLLPDYTITAELLAACLVLRSSILADASSIDHEYASTPGALAQFLCQARRRGFRNVVVNRAVVQSPLTYADLYPSLDDAEQRRVRASYPDSALAEEQISNLAQRRLEPVLSAAFPGRGRPRVLVDCRGLPEKTTGSAQCIFGFLDGFTALGRTEDVDLLVSSDAARFHQMAERYDGFRQISDFATGHYFAAVSLTQPWAIATVAELHRHALVTVFNMLDTIAWDILYVQGATGLGAVWRFIAKHADGLLFDSAYTRDRFHTRFPVNAEVAEEVTHLSLVAEEYIDADAEGTPVSDYILIFGNELDHKHLRPTLDVLVDGFPYTRIVVFGLRAPVAPNVTAIPSGLIGQLELHRLIAGARVIVYPSLYEGFGLPVVEGLSYGRPVVVRRSQLWAEIAGSSRLPGHLMEFDDAPSLIENVGRALAGSPSSTVPSGVLLDGDSAPVSWKGCAARVFALLERCRRSADGRRWTEREDTLQLAGF